MEKVNQLVEEIWDKKEKEIFEVSENLFLALKKACLTENRKLFNRVLVLYIRNLKKNHDLFIVFMAVKRVLKRIGLNLNISEESINRI